LKKKIFTALTVATLSIVLGACGSGYIGKKTVTFSQANDWTKSGKGYVVKNEPVQGNSSDGMTFYKNGRVDSYTRDMDKSGSGYRFIGCYGRGTYTVKGSKVTVHPMTVRMLSYYTDGKVKKSHIKAATFRYKVKNKQLIQLPSKAQEKDVKSNKLVFEPLKPVLNKTLNADSLYKKDLAKVMDVS